MAVPLIIMAISAAAKQHEAEQVAQANLDAEEHGLADQAKYRGDISGDLTKLIGGLGTDTPAKATASDRADYLKALNSAMPGGGTDINGGADYTADKAQEAIGKHAQAINLADMLSKITGVNDMRRTEGYQIGDTGMDVNKLANFSRGQYGADTLHMNNQPNPTVDFLANLGMAYGMGQLGKAGTPGKTGN